MSKTYTPREAAIMVLKKAEELFALEKARVDEGKDKYTKAYNRAERNNRTRTTTISREPAGADKFFHEKKPEVSVDVRHGRAGSKMGSAYMPGSQTKTVPGHEDAGPITHGSKVVGTPAKTPNTPNSRFKSSPAVGKSEEDVSIPMKGHIKLARFVGRMDAKRGKPIEKAADPLNPIAGDRMKRGAGYKERGDEVGHKIAVEGAKDSHKERLQGIKEAPKPKLP